MANQVNDDTRIDGTRPRAHHDAFERRKSHGGFDAAAVANGGQRAAVSKMARDHAPHSSPQHFGRSRRCVVVTDAVKSEAADAFLEPFVRSRVYVRLWRQCGMKCSVENCDLWNPGSESARSGIDGF